MPRTILLAAVLALAATARAETRHPIARSEKSETPASTSSTGFWLGGGGIAAALAVFGGFSLAAKKAKPGDSANLRVVGRANLSPRHSVYLLRVGDRTLIVGTGGQGAPSLLGELAPEPAPSPVLRQSARLAATIGGPA